jgi:hypothetical protein
MERLVLPPELDVDVDFGSVEDVELESAVLELVVLAPIGELTLPPNWVNTVTERTASKIAAATKVNRVAAELVMKLLRLPCRAQILWSVEKLSSLEPSHNQSGRL